MQCWDIVFQCLEGFKWSWVGAEAKRWHSGFLKGQGGIDALPVVEIRGNWVFVSELSRVI